MLRNSGKNIIGNRFHVILFSDLEYTFSWNKNGKNIEQSSKIKLFFV